MITLQLEEHRLNLSRDAGAPDASGSNKRMRLMQLFMRLSNSFFSTPSNSKR